MNELLKLMFLQSVMIPTYKINPIQPDNYSLIN